MVRSILLGAAPLARRARGVWPGQCADDDPPVRSTRITTMRSTGTKPVPEGRQITVHKATPSYLTLGPAARRRSAIGNNYVLTPSTSRPRSRDLRRMPGTRAPHRSIRRSRRGPVQVLDLLGRLRSPSDFCEATFAALLLDGMRSWHEARRRSRRRHRSRTRDRPGDRAGASQGRREGRSAGADGRRDRGCRENHRRGRRGRARFRGRHRRPRPGHEDVRRHRRRSRSGRPAHQQRRRSSPRSARSGRSSRTPGGATSRPISAEPSTAAGRRFRR